MEILHKLSNITQFRWRISVRNSQDANIAWVKMKELTPKLYALGVIEVFSRADSAFIENPILNSDTTEENISLVSGSIQLDPVNY